VRCPALLRALLEQLVLASNLFVKRVMFFQMSLRQVGKAHAARRLRQFATMNFLQARCFGSLFFRESAAFGFLPLQKLA